MDPVRRPVPRLTRRHFLGGAVVLVCGAPVFGCGGGAANADAAADAGADLPADPGGVDAPDAADGLVAGDVGGSEAAETGGPVVFDGWPVPAGTTLAPERHAQLSALFDALIPGSAEQPGAAECDAAWYLDQLLGAFSVSPPRIFAGGPYSGRRGGLDGFSTFLPLTRVEEICWRTLIEGSRGLPEREFNGPVKGFAARYDEGLAALDEAARAAHQVPYTQTTRDQRRKLLVKADADFVKMAYTHAVEGTYGDPVYGGNRDQQGWMLVDFEGDRQPVGFSARQLLHPEEGWAPALQDSADAGSVP